MSSVSLHLFLTNIQNQTRLFKEARYLIQGSIVERVVVLGLWTEGLPREEITDYGLEIRRLPILVRRYRNAWKPIRKLLALVSVMQYTLHALSLARSISPTHISCHNATMLPVVWLAAAVSGAVLIYVPHELETHRFGMSRLEKLFTKIVEKLLIRKAREIVVVCEPIADWYRNAYGLKNVYVVRNVPESDAIQVRRPVDGSFRDRFNIPKTATIFIYQGLFGEGRGTDQLLKIFSQIDGLQFHLVLMGYGEAGSQQQVERAAETCANIHYQPAVSREWITSYTSGADVGIVISENASLSYQYSLPNKFYEYVHAGLPVLASNNLVYMSNLIREKKIGWSVPFDELNKAILNVANSDLKGYCDRARKFAAGAVWESDAAVFPHIYRPK